jgi:hypothetical protein
VGPSLTPGLFPGSSLSTASTTCPFSRCSPRNLPLPADCSLSTQIRLLNPFMSFAICIVPSNLAGKPADRSYRWVTLSTSSDANRRSRTCLLLCYDCVDPASADLNRPLTILRRFLQPAYFFEYDAGALFLLSQVSYSYILILVGPSLMLRLAPGLSLSTASTTCPLFSLLTQESPATC